MNNFIGFIFGLIAILSQMTVFIQPLLPEKFQISPACVMVMSLSSQFEQEQQIQHSHMAMPMMGDMPAHHMQHDFHQTHHHIPIDQCPYCFIYGHISVLVASGIDEVFDYLKVKYLLILDIFLSFFFLLHNLFLIPQGRAPPTLS